MDTELKSGLYIVPTPIGNLKDITLIPTKAIAVALDEHKELDDFIQEEINYNAAAAKYQVNIEFYRNYQNLKTIISIFDIPEDAVMLDKIRAVKRGEEPSQVSKNSDHLGLPGPPYKSIMENLYGPNYRHESSNPFNYNDMISNLNGSSSSSSSDEKGHPDNSSSSEKGGRRRSRKLRGRKLRKTMRRK